MSIHRNTIYNIIGAVIPLAVSIVTIPLYLKLIGEARYGIMAIAWLLLGYFGLFDLGLGQATAQRIAALRNGGNEERAQTFWTALQMNVGIGFVGGLLIWPIGAYFFGSVFKVEDVLRPEMLAAVPWLILAVPMATLSGVLIGALQGTEQFGELNVISVFSTILFQLLPLTVGWFISVKLNIILPTALFARLLSLVILFLRCRRHVIRGYSPCFVRSQASLLLRFGGWVTVTSFVGPIMVILDRFIIGAVVGARSVTYYVVPFQLGEKTVMIPVALTSALFPRLASASIKEQEVLSHEALHVLLVVMTPIVVIGILFIEPFLKWWVGYDLASQSALVGQLILFGFWANGFARVPYAQLQARGRPDLVAKCHIAEVLPYLVLLYIGLKFYGLPGAAVAYSVRTFVDLFLLSSCSGLLKQLSYSIIIPLFVLLCSLILCVNITAVTDRISFTLIIAGITIIWTWLKKS